MTQQVYNDPVTQDVFVEGPTGNLVWSTQFAPVNLLPDENKITLSPFTITYPDFTKGGAYGYGRGTFGGVDLDGCITAVTLVPQTWTSTPIIVGTVPSGCNYIDVRVTMSRIKNPDNMLDIAVSNNLPTQETVLPGGWCLVESESEFSRTFQFYLSGTNILFSQKQSTFASQTNPNWTTDYNTPGWSWWGDPEGALVGRIDQDNGVLGGGGSRRRGGAMACSMSTAGFDFSSIYSGAVVIRPGYIAP